MKQPTRNFDDEYLRVLRDVLIYGKDTPDRTGTGTRRLFGPQMEFDIEGQFPLLTTKKINYKAVINELVWMVSLGSTDVKWLQDQGHTFWDDWCHEDGTIGPGYGKQFRDCKGVDQVKAVVNSIKKDPYGRRHVISLWQPDEIEDMALPPCHGLVIQFFVEDDKYLSCKMYQRSGDMFLGVPWNIAFYSLLTRLIAQLAGLTAKTFIHTIGDAHIYLNHIDQVKEQLTRKPKPYPYLVIGGDLHSIDDFRYECVQVIGYDPHPSIKAEISA
ncbi:MAG: thymidylate synthase [Glaciecola sp.]